jgi:putative colanic acid biosynthesis acetyltransferase WcaF
MSCPKWKQTLWSLIGSQLFRLSPHIAHRFRRNLLRFFGATVDQRAKIRRSARIDCPWNLTLRELAIVGDHAILNCSSTITLGARSVVSQLAVISTRMRDPKNAQHAFIQAPVSIEDDAWVAADTLVLPGATVSQGTVVGARGLVESEQTTEPWHICVGQPARAIKKRAYFARKESGGGQG